MVLFVVLHALVDALRFLLRGVVFVARLLDVAVPDARVALVFGGASCAYLPCSFFGGRVLRVYLANAVRSARGKRSIFSCS